MNYRIFYKRNTSYCPEICLPPSKSIEARRMVLDAVHGNVPWVEPDSCDDLLALGRALRGYVYREHELNVGLSGTALRFLTALCAVTPGYHVHIVGEPGLERRPIGPLAEQLRRRGAYISADFAPLEIVGSEIDGSRIDIDTLFAADSSQYVSALMLVQSLMSSPLPEFEVPKGSLSWPYIHMTRRMLAGDIEPEADWSAASYFYVVTLLTGVMTSFNPLLSKPNISKQGDSACFRLSSTLGVDTSFHTRGTRLSRDPGEKRGPFHFILGGQPDLVPALAVMAGFDGGGARLADIAHLRVKESNRLESVTASLRGVGIEASYDNDSIMIGERQERWNAVVDCCGDHRIAMAFAPCAAFLPGGLTLLGAECVSKSFPGYFENLSKFGYKICTVR